MPQSNGKPVFPLGKTITTVSLVGGFVLAVTIFIALSFQLVDSQGAYAMLCAGIASWVVCVASLVFLSRMDTTQPLKIAYAQMLGSIGRLVLLAGLALVLHSAYQFPSKPVIIGMVVVYLPLMFIEAVIVAGFVKSVSPANESSATLTEQVS